MKKILKFILLFAYIFFFPFIITYAEGEEKAKSLTCVYGPSGNNYYRLVQTPDGVIKWQMTNRANVDYTDITSNSSIYWSGDSEFAGNDTILKASKKYDETNKYTNEHLTGCPAFLVHYLDDGRYCTGLFHIFDSKCGKVLLVDEKTGKDETNNYDGISYLPKVFETEKVPTYFNDPDSSYEGLESITECSALLGDPIEDIGSPAYYLVKAFHVIKYVALILLIVLSVVDVTGAIAKQDKDAMTKLLKKIMMRFILCVIIFLLPYLITLLLKYLVYRQTTWCKANW